MSVPPTTFNYPPTQVFIFADHAPVSTQCKSMVVDHNCRLHGKEYQTVKVNVDWSLSLHFQGFKKTTDIQIFTVLPRTDPLTCLPTEGAVGYHTGCPRNEFSCQNVHSLHTALCRQYRCSWIPQTLSLCLKESRTSVIKQRILCGCPHNLTPSDPKPTELLLHMKLQTWKTATTSAPFSLAFKLYHTKCRL